jgi:uncharacterized protein YndB with AHSA1/START domain
MNTSVRREVRFQVSAEELWRALTDPTALSDWFANEVELDARPGGTGIFRWDDGSERRATVDVVEHERRLGFHWEDERGNVSRVRLALAEDSEGTCLTVTETPAAGPEANALAGEWSWGIELLAALPRLRRPVRA